MSSSGEICVVKSDFRFVKARMRLHTDAQGISRIEQIFKHCSKSHLSPGRTHTDLLRNILFLRKIGLLRKTLGRSGHKLLLTTILL